MGGIFGKKAEDVQGSIINGVTIIGDTGKRDSSGNQIVIARNKNNEVFESSLSNIKRGVVNGTGEESGYVNLKKLMKNTMLKELTLRLCLSVEQKALIGINEEINGKHDYISKENMSYKRISTPKKKQSKHDLQQKKNISNLS